jgi:ADP-ribose pyrophosphatase YjhB (NUDIX family)
MAIAMKHFKQTQCTNCGIIGHHFRSCTAPIYSYGILAVKVPNALWNQAEKLCASDSELNGFPHEDIQYLMVQRRDSIGFVELLRAKYKTTDLAYIQTQIEGTTLLERQALKTKTFEQLWIDLWGASTFETKQYRQEYEQAKQKFEQLKQGIEIDGSIITLDMVLDSTPVRWTTPEWGFPKGRRNVGETDIACAIREFQEETGLQRHEYCIFEGMEPILETFFGNNNIHYCHVYYLAFVPESCVLKPETSNEIGGFGWFSLKDALDKIRSTNVEKRELLLRASTIFKNCSLLLIETATPQQKNKGQPLDYRRLNFLHQEAGITTSST